MLNKAKILDDGGFCKANNSKVKISEMILALVGISVGVEARNTYMWDAEAGEMNE